MVPTGVHADHMDAQGLWPNVEVQERVRIHQQQSVQRSKSTKRHLHEIAARGAKGRRETLEAERSTHQAPIVRTDDSGAALEAAERYQPKRDSAKGRVLSYLQERLGEWVDAPDLTTEAVGGFAGTRRLRELRDAGWPIETRPKPGSVNTWQHRLLPEDSPNW